MSDNLINYRKRIAMGHDVEEESRPKLKRELDRKAGRKRNRMFINHVIDGLNAIAGSSKRKY